MNETTGRRLITRIVIVVAVIVAFVLLMFVLQRLIDPGENHDAEAATTFLAATFPGI